MMSPFALRSSATTHAASSHPRPHHQRRPSSTSSSSTTTDASSSAASVSPVTSPTRPPHARRKLDFGLPSSSSRFSSSPSERDHADHDLLHGLASSRYPDDDMARSLELGALQLGTSGPRRKAADDDVYRHHAMFTSPDGPHSPSLLRAGGGGGGKAPASPSPPVPFHLPSRTAPLSFSPSPSTSSSSFGTTHASAVHRPPLARRPPFSPGAPPPPSPFLSMSPAQTPFFSMPSSTPPMTTSLPLGSARPRMDDQQIKKPKLSKSTSSIPAAATAGLGGRLKGNDGLKPQGVQRLRPSPSASFASPFFSPSPSLSSSSSSSSLNGTTPRETPPTSRRPSPAPSPRLPLGEQRNTVAPARSPLPANEARPSPDAFRETLMRKSHSGGVGAGAGPGGAHAQAGAASGNVFGFTGAVRSPALGMSRSPLHLSSTSTFPSSSCSSSSSFFRGKENVPPPPSPIESAASSSTSSQRRSSTQPRTSYFPASPSSTFESRIPRSTLSHSASSSSLRALASTPSSSSALRVEAGRRDQRLTPMKPSRLFRTSSSRVDVAASAIAGELHGLGLGLSPPGLAGLALTSSSNSLGRASMRSSGPAAAGSSPRQSSQGLKRKGSSINLSSSQQQEGWLKTTPSPSSRRRSALASLATIASSSSPGMAMEVSSGGSGTGPGGMLPRRPPLKRCSAGEDRLAARFEIGDVLGQGVGGVVWRVVERDSGRVGAVKVSTVYAGARDRIRHLEELDILRLFSSASSSHPHIIYLLSSWEYSARLHLHTPLYSSGDLSAFLSLLSTLPPTPGSTSLAYSPFHSPSASGGLDEPRAWKLLAALSGALEHAHALGVLHMDVKPSNILIDGEGNVKLGDWGHATRWPRRRASEIVRGAGVGGEAALYGSEEEVGDFGLDREGDRDYLSAEGVRGVIGPEGDVFSLGLLVLEALTAIVPPASGEPWQKLRSDDFSDLESSLSPIPASSSASCLDPFDFSSSSSFYSPASSVATSSCSSTPFSRSASPSVSDEMSLDPSFGSITLDSAPSPLVATPCSGVSATSTAFVPLTKPWASAELSGLVKRMMRGEARERPSMREVSGQWAIVSVRERGEGRATLVEEDVGWLEALLSGHEGEAMDVC